MLANISAGGNDELLIFAIHQLAHTLDEQALSIFLENGVPLAAPKYFYDVPTGATECRFEFLNDLSVAADRSVKALEIAIDDEDEIVELLAGGECDRAERFGLVCFAVAEERPNFCVADWFDAAIFEITAEARLINGHQRAEAHRNGGEFPEIGH